MRSRESAFTRLDCTAAIAAASLVAIACAPLLNASRGDTRRQGCKNNLRQVVIAFQDWATDHDEWLPWNVFVADGGSRAPTGVKPGVAWIEYTMVSNQLASPRMLACPADRSTKPAENWGGGTGGLINSGHRGNALSYILGAHAQMAAPRSFLAADRDFNPGADGTMSCSRGFSNTRAVYFQSGFVQPAWTNLLHSTAGQVAFMDGSVDTIASSDLRYTFAGPEANDAGGSHYLPPR